MKKDPVSAPRDVKAELLQLVENVCIGELSPTANRRCGGIEAVRLSIREYNISTREQLDHVLRALQEGDDKWNVRPLRKIVIDFFDSYQLNGTFKTAEQRDALNMKLQDAVKSVRLNGGTEFKELRKALNAARQKIEDFFKTIEVPVAASEKNDEQQKNPADLKKTSSHKAKQDIDVSSDNKSGLTEDEALVPDSEYRV